jgi:hypothetical protein
MNSTTRSLMKAGSLSLKRNCLLAPLAAAGLMMASPGVGNADTITDTFVQSSDHCSNGGCTTDTNNIITVTDNGSGTLNIHVQLDNNWFFISSGAGGGASLGWSMFPATETFTNGTTVFAAGGWEPAPGGSAASPQTVPFISSLQMDGITITHAYGMTWTAGNGNANHDSNTLDFNVSGSLADLDTTGANLSGTQCTPCEFAADVLAANGATGIIDFSLQSTTVGAPGPTVGAGLPGVLTMVLVGGFMWWRRKLTFSLMP